MIDIHSQLCSENYVQETKLWLAGYSFLILLINKFFLIVSRLISEEMPIQVSETPRYTGFQAETGIFLELKQPAYSYPSVLSEVSVKYPYTMSDKCPESQLILKEMTRHFNEIHRFMCFQDENSAPPPPEACQGLYMFLECKVTYGMPSNSIILAAR